MHKAFERASSQLRDWVPRPPWVYLLALVAVLAIGFAIADDYGISWDEPLNVAYGRWALDQYRGARVFQWAQLPGSSKGPAYFMFYTSVGDLLSGMIPAWQPSDGRHFVNFITFLFGVFSFYLLANRILGTPSAWLTTAFFASQPLLFGHAFINQKDIPFLALFLASLAFGLRAVDGYSEGGLGRGGNADRPLRSVLREEWRARRGRGLLLIGLTVLLVVIEVGLLREWLLLPWLEASVVRAYEGEAGPVWTTLFGWMASGGASVPSAAYLRELHQRYVQLIVLSFPGSALVFLLAMRRSLPRTVDRLRGFVRSRLAHVAFPAVLLGITVSLREVGPLAGALVSLYFLIKRPLREVHWLVVYWLLAGAVTYLVWPVLWGNPIEAFLNRLANASRFPRSHPVLYRGEYISSLNLPWHYFPWLLTIQMTEPFLLAVPLGLIGFGRRWIRGELRMDLAALFFLWFVVPASGIVVLGTPIYGNIRHTFFSLPPLFLLAGLGIELLYRVLTKIRWRLLLAVAILFPGVVAIFTGHPYQYVHYNSLVGGPRGAETMYEMDHWCLSYREAMEHVNLVAPPESSVAVHEPIEAARPFAREDLVVELPKDVGPNPNYALACDRRLYSGEYYPEMRVVHEITHRGAVLGQVKESGPEAAGP